MTADTTSDEPLLVYRATVEPAWLDYNGHMNEAFYLLVFSRATDLLLDAVGLDQAYRDRARRSVYTAETHIRYLAEVGLGAPLRVTVRLLGFDAKRLHLWAEMFRAGAMREGDRAASAPGTLLATAEMLALHVDTGVPAACPFPPEVAARLAALHEQHAALPRPAAAGRAIRRV